MGDRQLDILWAGPDWYTLPKNLPGVLRADDFVFFKHNLDARRYTIIVESLDAAGPPFRTIGPLQDEVQLPFVRFGWHPRIGVIPDSNLLPAFEAELIRGSTYFVPSTDGKNGRYQMERHGVHRPN